MEECQQPASSTKLRFRVNQFREWNVAVCEKEQPCARAVCEELPCFLWTCACGAGVTAE